MAEAYGDQGGNRNFDNLVSGGEGLWLVVSTPAASTAASASGNLEGFCRLVPDEETRARRRACMDMLYVKEGARRDDLGRALIGAVREAASENDFEGIWGYFNDSLGLDFLVATGGRLLREIRLLRNERLDDVAPPKLPEGYRIRPVSPPVISNSPRPSITPRSLKCGISARTRAEISPGGSRGAIRRPRTV
jgi:GNAT superfamily N-acetyltransferase